MTTLCLQTALFEDEYNFERNQTLREYRSKLKESSTQIEKANRNITNYSVYRKLYDFGY